MPDSPSSEQPASDRPLSDRGLSDQPVVTDTTHGPSLAGQPGLSQTVPAQPAPSEPAPSTPAVPAPATPAAVTNFNIGEEFGTAKRNLPPLPIVLLCIAAVAVVVGIFAFHQRAKPQGNGSVDFVSAAEVPNQGIVLAAITFTFHNTADKSLWIHTLKANLTTADGHSYEDEAASAVDVDRYFQAFPPLKESSEPPLPPETKLPAGTEKKGTIIVSFPVSKEAFDQRKSLTVTIQPYDQPLPVILK